jgi:hypothetical protein
MAVNELGVFPQVTYSEGQGHTGVRHWTLDYGDDVFKFVAAVCASHWPKEPDSVPVSVQWGPYSKSTVLKREGDRTRDTIGDLPTYGKILVVAHYAMHKLTNCWPSEIPKPWHPEGTSLSLKIRGSGQYILISPAGMRTGQTPMVDPNCRHTGLTEAFSHAVNCRIVCPVTEYRLTCGRMTPGLVDAAMNPHWDSLQGTVNSKPFLRAEEGTLLFDGYELEDTYVCDANNPHRYNLSATLKQRVILDDDGVPLKVGSYSVGWNHDFVNVKGDTWGWRRIFMLNEGKDCNLRYIEHDFRTMFGGQGKQKCGDTGKAGTKFKDCDFCGSAGADEEGPNDSGSYGTNDSGTWVGPSGQDNL